MAASHVDCPRAGIDRGRPRGGRLPVCSLAALGHQDLMADARFENGCERGAMFWGVPFESPRRTRQMFSWFSLASSSPQIGEPDFFFEENARRKKPYTGFAIKTAAEVFAKSFRIAPCAEDHQAGAVPSIIAEVAQRCGFPPKA